MYDYCLCEATGFDLVAQVLDVQLLDGLVGQLIVLLLEEVFLARVHGHVVTAFRLYDGRGYEPRSLVLRQRCQWVLNSEAPPPLLLDCLPTRRREALGPSSLLLSSLFVIMLASAS